MRAAVAIGVVTAICAVTAGGALPALGDPALGIQRVAAAVEVTPGPLLVDMSGAPGGMHEPATGQVDRIVQTGCDGDRGWSDLQPLGRVGNHLHAARVTDWESAVTRPGHMLVLGWACNGETQQVAELNTTTGRVTRLPSAEKVMGYGPEPGTLIAVGGEVGSGQFRVRVINRAGDNVWAGMLSGNPNGVVVVSRDRTAFAVFGNDSYSVIKVGDGLETTYSLPPLGLRSAISPDLTHVAYIGDGTLTVRELATETDTVVGDAHVEVLAWSPDGSRLEFAAAHGEDPPTRAIYDLAGDRVVDTGIALDPDGTSPLTEWAPDSQRLVVSLAIAVAGNADVNARMVDAETGTSVPIPDPLSEIPDFYLTSHVHWSPDSASVAILRTKGVAPLNDVLVVVDAAGETVSRRPTSNNVVSLGPWPSCDQLCSVGVVARPCTISGTDEGERLRGTRGDDVICGLGGDDLLRPLSGDDIIVGGRGHDALDYSVGVDRAIVNLRLGSISLRGEPALSGIERVIGSDGRDRLTGDGTSTFLAGGGGDDVLQPLSGDVDDVAGGPGIDTLSYADGPVPIQVDLQQGSVTSAAGNVTVRGVESVIGSDKDDRISGDEAANRFFGGDGDDLLLGRGGSDYLLGIWGANTLEGGTGNDRLQHDRKDIVDGGPGADLCATGLSPTAGDWATC